MFRYLKNKDEKGFTLIELLAVIVILAIVMVSVTVIMVKSITKYDTISAEIHLRDEADLVMSQLYSSLYKLKESQVCDRTSLSSAKPSLNYSSASPANCSNSASVQAVGYEGNERFNLVNGQTYQISNKNITVTAFTVTRKSTSRYEINLELKMKGKNITRKFNNEVLTINDLNI